MCLSEVFSLQQEEKKKSVWKYGFDIKTTMKQIPAHELVD